MPVTGGEGRKRCQDARRSRGSGAPAGNRNVLKHGPYTRELLRESAEKLELVQVGRGPPEEM